MKGLTKKKLFIKRYGMEDKRIEELKSEIKKIEWIMLYTKQGEEFENLEKRKEFLENELLKILAK